MKAFFTNTLKKLQITILLVLIFKVVVVAQDFASIKNASNVYSKQNPNGSEVTIRLSFKNKSIIDVFTHIEKNTHVRFIYNADILKDAPPVSLNDQIYDLNDVLTRIGEQTSFQFKRIGSMISVAKKAPLSINTSETAVSEKKQEAVPPVNGTVKDSKGEVIVGASIVIKGTNTGAVTDENGNFSVEAKEGDILVISYVGYILQEYKVGKDATSIAIVLASDDKILTEVAIVGSRSNTARTSTETAAPVDVITAKELRSFSQVDVGQILNFVAPSFNSNRQTVTDGTDHLDPASLRGLGPDQVLVLVNGKRRHNSALVNINGTVGRGSVGTDMNVIPVAAIERIEVLRDGAAAQYGSDAIAGVINVVMKKNYEGLTASLTTGTHVTNMKYSVPTLGGGSTEKTQSLNDGQMVQLDITKGLRLGSKGALTLTAQYNERGKTNRSGDDNAPTIYLGASGGFPSTPSGQVQNDFRTKLIADDATLVKQNNYDRHNMVFGNSSSRNIGLFANGYVPTGAVSQVYFSGGITYRDGKGFGNNRVPVSRTQQPLKADGSLFYPNGFLPAIFATIQDQSIIAGYKTNFSGWDFDISNTFGQNSFGFEVRESGNASLANGTNPTEFDAGKLKFRQNTTNIDFSKKFEEMGSLSNFNLALGAEVRNENFTIKAGEVNSYIGADLKKTVPAAPLTIGGASPGTALALPGSQVFPGYQPSDEVDKSRTSYGLYADLEGELAKRLLLAVAGRYENFSDFGSNFSGKVSARLKFTDNLALRGSFSTGFRAPSLHQRYFQNTSTQFVSGLPSNTLTVNNDNEIARKVIGVDALRPETSTSMTVGATASFGKFSLTVDAYQIDIKDRIVYSGAFSRAILGFTADQYVGINNVNFFANAANTKTQGIDIVASHRVNIDENSRLTVTLALNFNKNEVTDIISTKLIEDSTKNRLSESPDTWFKNRLFDRQQRSRIEVFQPQNKINLSLAYTLGKFDITIRTVRFGEIKYVHNLDTEAKKGDGTFWNTQFSRDAAGAAYIDQTFSAKWITDLTLGYRFSEKFGISVGANNLLDVYPDQIYIDPRNATGSLDYVSGRDASNRGRFLFQPNQGGFNGRFIFARLNVSL
jgi:iron complex outermembrane recepter protein